MKIFRSAGDTGTGSGKAIATFLAVLLFFLVSGACGLLYQVVWTRQLVLLFGTTAYAVSTVLSIFFLGLGVGSFWGGRLADRVTRPLLVYGVFEIVVGIWALLFLFLVQSAEVFLPRILTPVDAGPAFAIGLRAVFACLLLFVPVTLMGATLPLLAKFITREPTVRGFRIGALYGANTLGAIAGCFFTGFFLLPTLGYSQTTLIGVAGNVAAGLAATVIALAGKTPPRPAPYTEGEQEPHRDLPQRRGASEDPTLPVYGGTKRGEPQDLAFMRTEAAEVSSTPATLPPVPNTLYPLLLAAFALTGFCFLALEVVWTRILTIVFLGTTYAYTTMLTTLLAGIFAGAIVASLFVDRIARHVFAAGIAILLAGISTLWMLGNFAALPQVLNDPEARPLLWGVIKNLATLDGWTEEIALKFLLAFSVLFPPTFCSGMAFPIIVKAVGAGRDRVGREVGRLYSANTIGGVAGAAVGGFILLPLLGAQLSILLLGGMLAAAGALLVLRAPLAGRRAKTLLLAAGVVLVAAALYRAPEDVSRALNVGYVPADHRVVHFKEGVEGTVVVSEPIIAGDGSNRVLWINRVQATASIEKGVRMNRLQGVLPLLFEHAPEDVLFMCFGSGITAGTLALSEFDRIDAVEISPEVLEAAPLFEVDNLGVIHRPNVHFHIDDGRNFLLTSARTFDLITFEPMPLALAGVSTFYTQDYYRLCLDRLNPGGIVSQWVPLHSLSPEVVRSLVYTFTTVFPHYCAYFINADLFLIGSNAPLIMDYAAASKRLARPDLATALAEVGFNDIDEVLACYIMDKPAVDAFAEGGRVMTDDLPWAEFEAPKLVYARTVQETLAQLVPHMTNPVEHLVPGSASDSEWKALERRYLARREDMQGLIKYYGGFNIGKGVVENFLNALAIDPEDNNARFYLRQIIPAQAETHLRWEEYEKVVAAIEPVLPYLPAEAELYRLLAQACAALGRNGEAESYRLQAEALE
ncbi:MAG: fused MFS/spermidine synthase [Candidatus Hydrogenedentes bacterium]|nr:fused MFS/spermidine synthase [Candidatus Hydrogenedentota bacterium]